jgi:hypothetical protein
MTSQQNGYYGNVKPTGFVNTGRASEWHSDRQMQQTCDYVTGERSNDPNSEWSVNIAKLRRAATIRQGKRRKEAAENAQNTQESYEAQYNLNDMGIQSCPNMLRLDLKTNPVLAVMEENNERPVVTGGGLLNACGVEFGDARCGTENRQWSDGSFGNAGNSIVPSTDGEFASANQQAGMGGEQFGYKTLKNLATTTNEQFGYKTLKNLAKRH